MGEDGAGLGETELAIDEGEVAVALGEGVGGVGAGAGDSNGGSGGLELGGEVEHGGGVIRLVEGGIVLKLAGAFDLDGLGSRIRH